MQSNENPIRHVSGFLTVEQAKSYLAYRSHRLELARQSGVAGGIAKCEKNLTNARIRLSNAQRHAQTASDGEPEYVCADCGEDYHECGCDERLEREALRRNG